MGVATDFALDIQHILASGQYLEYLFYGDQFKIKGDLSKCCQESITFLNDQYNAIQIDYPILTAYDCKIRDLELELINESQETSITSLAAAHQSFDKIYRIKGSVLTMMKSRSALLHQDVFIREQLLQIDTKINKYVPVMMQLQLCVKVHIMNGMEHEPITRKHLHDAVTNLLPWTNLREQKRAELQRCRADRAAMEKRLKNVKAELNHS